MDNIQEHYDRRQRDLIDEIAQMPLEGDEFAAAAKNLNEFSKVRTLLPEPEILPPVPTTRWGRFKAGASAVWDNETTRVFIKAGGAFAGVGLVVWSTIHKDHAMERTALAQANQRNS